jgi:hypothetical protein
MEIKVNPRTPTPYDHLLNYPWTLARKKEQVGVTSEYYQRYMYVSGKSLIRRLVHVSENDVATLARSPSSMRRNSLASRGGRKEKEEEAPPHQGKSTTNFQAQRPATLLVLQL